MKRAGTMRLKCCASLDDLGHREKIILARRRIRDDDIGARVICHGVGTQLHLHGNDRRHRLHAVNIDGAQFLDEGENGVQLLLEVRHVFVLHGDARQMRYAPDGRLIDGPLNSDGSLNARWL